MGKYANAPANRKSPMNLLRLLLLSLVILAAGCDWMRHAKTEAPVEAGPGQAV